MDNTWVKLYRKLGDNEVMRDPTALQVLIWLLLNVDKKTGEFTTGRFIGAHELNINPSTFRDAIYRLKIKYKIIDTTSDNKKTVISLLKWAEYQEKRELTTPTPTTKRQQSDTKQEYRIKTNTISLSENQINLLKKEFSYLDIDYEYRRFREWQRGTGKEFPNVLARFKAWLLQQRHEDKKETNVILEDPIFKQLQGVWKFNEGVGFIRKSDLQSRLGGKYPKVKFVREWEEINKILKTL